MTSLHCIHATTRACSSLVRVNLRNSEFHNLYARRSYLKTDTSITRSFSWDVSSGYQHVVCKIRGVIPSEIIPVRTTIALQNTYFVNNKHVRNLCSKPEQDNKDPTETTVVQEKRSFIQKVRDTGNNFVRGCKILYGDVRLAMKTSKKIGVYKRVDVLSRDDLTREEVRHLRQTRKDLVKALPVAMLFMVPFVGYFAPVLAYVFPKQLLSQQFWHPKQKKEFVLEEYEKRSQYYYSLVREVGVTCKEIKNRQFFRLCIEILDGKHPTTEELLHYKEEFVRDNDFSFQKMPRYHLVKLCRCWLIPTRWYLPRWFLISALSKRISNLHEDDLLLARDGIELLTPQETSDAVHVRGLDETSLCYHSEVHWLKEWNDLSRRVQGDANKISFLAHAAIFKAANFEELESCKGFLCEAGVH